MRALSFRRSTEFHTLAQHTARMLSCGLQAQPQTNGPVTAGSVVRREDARFGMLLGYLVSLSFLFRKHDAETAEF